MNFIFISYARLDSQFVDHLRRKLEETGFHVWLDRNDIRGGDQWRRQIVDAIESAVSFIIVLSSNSIKSVNVRKELDVAEGSGVQIFPIEISQITLPPEMKYQLAGLQRVDFKMSFDEGFSKLLVSLDKSQQIRKIGQDSVYRKQVDIDIQAEAVVLPNVWYREGKMPLVNQIFGYKKVCDDIGSLEASPNALVFRGEKRKIKMNEIRGISLEDPGTYICKWVKIEYFEHKTLEAAYFSDGGVSKGTKRNKKLLEKLRAMYLE